MIPEIEDHGTRTYAAVVKCSLAPWRYDCLLSYSALVAPTSFLNAVTRSVVTRRSLISSLESELVAMARERCANGQQMSDGGGDSL